MALELSNGSIQNGSTMNPSQNFPVAVQSATSSQNNQQSATQNDNRVWLSRVVYDIFWIPPSLTFTVRSNAGGGAVATTIYFFNTSFFNALVTNNTSGANSIVNTYGDGFSGRSYERLFGSASDKATGSKAGGILTTGFNLVSTVASTGAQNNSAFTTMNFNYLWSTSQGVMQPAPFDINSALSSGQYNIGIMNIGQNVYLNALTQCTCTIPVDNIFAYTFLTYQGM